MTDPRWDEAAARTVLDELIEEVAGLRLPLDANFFEAGVTSAMLLRVHAELVRRLGADIPLTDLFRYPNRRLLARRLVPQASAAAGPPGVPDPFPYSGSAASIDPAGPAPHARRALRSQIRARVQTRTTKGGQP